MEAQYAEAKEEVILELKAKTTTITVKDFTPAGARLEYNLQGQVTGRYNAQHIETVNALLKPDATGEYEIRIVETTSDGDVILGTGKGKARTESSGMIMVEGETKLMTSSKKLAWVNNIKGRHEGSYNPATGESLLRLHAKT